MRPKRDPTPLARLRFWPFLWATWAGLCMLGLLLAAAYVSGAVTVPQTQTYVGTLKPNQTQTKLKLPAGVPFKSMLVQVGEQVRAGQTVAVLDQAAMTAELAHIDRSIAVANVLRSCLLRSAELQNVSPPQNTVIEIDDVELKVLIQAAEADCATGRREDRLTRLRLERGLEILQERLILVNQKLAMVLGVHTQQAKKEVHPVLRAHASVSVAMERNDLLQKLQALSQELDSLRVSQDHARLVRISNISKEVALNLKHQAVLRTYLESPRLTVPESGRISRVRPVPAGTQFDQDQTILEVRGDQEAQFIANLRVPLDQVVRLPLGTKVQVSLAGFTRGGPKLQGVIDHWVEGDGETGLHYAMARVQLAQESQKALSDPQNGIALRGTSTASVIRAEMEPAKLNTLMANAFGSNLSWIHKMLVRLRGVNAAMPPPT